MSQIKIWCACSLEDCEYVNSFVQEAYRNSFGTEPGKVSWYVAASLENGELVGSLGLQFGQYEALPLHSIYKIEQIELPEEYSEKKTIYYSRFVAKSPHISIVLMYAATLYALKCGYVFGTAIFSNSLYKHLITMGILYQPVVYEALDLDKIPKKDHRYFKRTDIKPYIILLENKQKALKFHMTKILQELSISWGQEFVL